ncbi:diacylglycerol kinase [Leptotrichia shahii]|jgi:putative diacylglycerol kinase|uniref:Diacylglycerol kinase n=1 Tax=Leptotrichia shahii TaxID=157691 RepID=A0A510JPV1_9FUSO|nr:diacylglycerol kinase [Leptotrichia shahii]BBM41266.1 diacylglycerol kinase [Leptotrichia shahii]
MEKNKNNDKKKKRSIFSLFHKKNRYNWDIKKERARDKRLVDSFNFAIEGLISALKDEKHMKVHILAAIIIVILAILINASKVEILIISLSVSFVIITELVNTAVEAIIDLVSPERHPLAKLAKDVAAGAVLVAAINALCVGYLLFYDKLLDIFDGANKLHVIAGRKGNISILILILVSILVIVLKTFFRKGTPLEGGMPSGHSAIAFAAFGILAFMTSDIRILVLGFFMAALVAQSRVKSGIHSIREVLAGGLLGFSVAFAILFIMMQFGILYN